MPNPGIDFTDGAGAATLTNPSPRFSSWIPDVDPWADREHIEATKATVEFLLTDRAVVSFSITQLGPSQQATILRLKRHLMAGGTVTVRTEDLAARTYTCGLRSGTLPQIGYDPERMHYSISLELVRTDSDAGMLCIYRAT